MYAPLYYLLIGALILGCFEGLRLELGLYIAGEDFCGFGIYHFVFICQIQRKASRVEIVIK